jgi:hypothetical protein
MGFQKPILPSLSILRQRGFFIVVFYTKKLGIHLLSKKAINAVFSDSTFNFTAVKLFR